MPLRVKGDDGKLHFVGDDCIHEHYEARRKSDRKRFGFLACGGDFMAGTICSEPAGHLDGHGCTCPVCGGDWMNGTCVCKNTGVNV